MRRRATATRIAQGVIPSKRSLRVLVTVLVLGVATQSTALGATSLHRLDTTNGQRAANLRGCHGTNVLKSGRISLRYPSCWALSNYHEETTMTTVIDYLSNEPLHKPCTTKPSGVGTTTSCGFPLRKLEHGGALVIFIEGGSPGWTLSLEPGRHFVIDHHAARESAVEKANRSLGANEELVAYVVTGVEDNYYELWAFFRNPGTDDRQRFQQMLTSMRFK